MPHYLYRKKIITNIKTAIRDFNDIAYEEHPGLKGKIRERATKNLFEPLLPQGFAWQNKISCR